MATAAIEWMTVIIQIFAVLGAENLKSPKIYLKLFSIIFTWKVGILSKTVFIVCKMERKADIIETRLRIFNFSIMYYSRTQESWYISPSPFFQPFLKRQKRPRETTRLIYLKNCLIKNKTTNPPWLSWCVRDSLITTFNHTTQFYKSYSKVC